MDRAPEALRLLTPALDEIVPSLTNPRRRGGLGIDSLTALAEDMKANTLLQPIIIRTLPAHRLADTADMHPRPGYEIIAGERRFRAAQIAEWATIPALLRDDLGDVQVVQMQLVENIQRETLDPLDEAEGFALLRDKHGYTVAQIAAACAAGKGESYVYKRLTLVCLAPDVRDAMYEEQGLDVSLALLVARYRAEQQPDVLQYLRNMKKVNGEWPAFRSARAALSEAFHLILAHAPFDTASEQLLPEAGACTACPHRSGNQGDIFGDSHEQDACTNTACFQKKREAHAVILRTEFEKKGHKVIDGEEALQAKTGAKGVLAGFQRLDAVAFTQEGKDGVEREVTFGDALRSLGKKAPKPQIFIDPHSLDAVPVITNDLANSLVPEDDDEEIAPPKGRAKKSAQAAGDESPPPRTTPEEDAIANYNVEKAVKLRIFEAIRSRPRDVTDMRLIARALFAREGDYLPFAAEAYLGWDTDLEDQDERDSARIIGEKVDALPAEDLGQAIAMAAVDLFMNSTWTTDAQAIELAKQYGVDILAVRDKVAEDLARAEDAAHARSGGTALHAAQLERLIDKAVQAVLTAEAATGKKKPDFARLTAMRNEMNVLRDAQAGLRAGQTEEAMAELRELAGVGEFDGEGWATIVGDELRELLQPAEGDDGND